MLRYASADPTCTIVPRLRPRIRFNAANVPWTTPRYVTSVTRLNSSGSISSIGENTEVIALFRQFNTALQATRDTNRQKTLSIQVLSLPVFTLLCPKFAHRMRIVHA